MPLLEYQVLTQTETQKRGTWSRTVMDTGGKGSREARASCPDDISLIILSSSDGDFDFCIFMIPTQGPQLCCIQQ